MKPLIKIALLALVISVWIPHQAEALPYTAPYIPSVRQVIVKQAQVFAAPEKELLLVAQCESSFNPNAVGDKGLAHGIFQYHKSTFDRYAKLMGENLDYYSYFDQARLTAYIFATFPQYKKAWSCYTKIVAITK